MVVPVAGTKVCEVALKEVPFHHLFVLVSSMATAVVEMVPVEFEVAFPVMVPVQLWLLPEAK